MPQWQLQQHTALHFAQRRIAGPLDGDKQPCVGAVLRAESLVTSGSIGLGLPMSRPIGLCFGQLGA